MKELFSWLVFFGEKDRFGTFFLAVGNDVVFAKKVGIGYEIFKATGAKCLLIASETEAFLIVEKIFDQQKKVAS